LIVDHPHVLIEDDEKDQDYLMKMIHLKMELQNLDHHKMDKLKIVVDQKYIVRHDNINQNLDGLKYLNEKCV
jgi:hypothetical protein